MLSVTRARKNGHCDEGDGSSSKDRERKNIPVFEVKKVPLHYTLEVWNRMSYNFNRKSHLVNVYGDAVHFCKIRSTCGKRYLI